MGEAIVKYVPSVCLHYLCNFGKAPEGGRIKNAVAIFLRGSAPLGGIRLSLDSCRSVAPLLTKLLRGHNDPIVSRIPTSKTV